MVCLMFFTEAENRIRIRFDNTSLDTADRRVDPICISCMSSVVIESREIQLCAKAAERYTKCG